MTIENFSPFITVDVVLMALVQGELHIGLVRRDNENEPFYGAWCLPGGFVRPQEDDSAMDTALRVLREKAQVHEPHLEQLATFSGSGRDPRGWSASIAYYALVASHVAPEDTDVFRWEKAERVLSRTLAFDHSTIVKTAVERVRNRASYSSLPIFLMPPAFTITELRNVYEQLLGGELEQRGFIRRLEEMDIVEPTGTTKTEKHRPAKLYRAKGQRGLAQLGPSIMTR